MYVNKGIDYIIQNKSTYYLEKFLLLIINLKIYISYELFNISKNIDYQDIYVILEAIKDWSINNFDEKEIYIRPYNSVYSINEIIRNTRNYSNKTQEELILSKDGDLLIGNQCSISNIENCKENTYKKIIKAFFTNIGNWK